MSTTRDGNEKQKEEKIQFDLNGKVNKPFSHVLYDSREEKNDKEKGDECFYVLGCAGNGTEHQKAVAKLMDDIAQKKKRNPQFIIILGDNFYDAGVERVNDPSFKTNFDDIYKNKKLSVINGIPCFLILGNHDHNARNELKNHLFGELGGVKNLDKAAAQVAHTYYDETKTTDKNVVYSQEKIKLYENEKLDLAKLPTWNMIGRYGSLRSAEDEFFMIDSTTYLNDYLLSLCKHDDKDNSNNQANWLARVMKESKAKRKFLCLHHPVHDVVSKRVLHSDAKIFLSDGEIESLKKEGVEGNYNDMLSQLLKKQGIKFDTIFSAHNHSLSYSKDNDVVQVVSGGGGGELQEREYFKEWKDVGCYVKENGFVEVTRTKSGEIEYDFHTVNGLHLYFDHKNKQPIRFSSQEKTTIEMVRNMAIEAVEICMEAVGSQQPERSKILRQSGYIARLSKGVSLFANYYAKKATHHVLDRVKNYFNQREELTLEEGVNFLSKEMNADRGSDFFSTFARLLKSKNQLTMDEWLKNPALIATTKRETVSEIKTNQIDSSYFNPEEATELASKGNEKTLPCPSSFKVLKIDVTTLTLMGLVRENHYSPSASSKKDDTSPEKSPNSDNSKSSKSDGEESQDSQNSKEIKETKEIIDPSRRKESTQPINIQQKKAVSTSRRDVSNSFTDPQFYTLSGLNSKRGLFHSQSYSSSSSSSVKDTRKQGKKHIVRVGKVLF